MRPWMAGAVAAAAVIVALSGAAAGQTGWSAFKHPTHGFTIAYPEDWEVARPDDPIAFMALGPRPAGVADLRLNVNVTTERVPTTLTVERFEAASEQRMGLLFNGYQRLRTDRTTSGGLPAILRYYTWKRNDGIGLYQMQLYVVAGERGYVVTGTTSTQSAALKQEAALLLRIITTFRP